jgi:HK97 family phage prohead protease
MVRETICRGAFDGIERRANRIRANRDHDEKRTFGRAVTFHPNTAEGLLAVVKAARTPLGDETLELAEDGCLDASAGFVPKDGGMRWMARSAYQITKGWLRHIALVPEAAYDEARVLAVRSAQRASASKTPNLDEVRSWRLEDRLRSGLPE